jgi:hypothetical protein
MRPRRHYHYDTPVRRGALYSSKAARLAKVVYFICYVFALLIWGVFSFMIVRAGFSPVAILIALALIVGFFEVVRRAFYYVMRGTIAPPK